MSLCGICIERMNVWAKRETRMCAARLVGYRVTFHLILGEIVGSVVTNVSVLLCEIDRVCIVNV